MWLRVIEVWLTTKLLASPLFHRAVRSVHKKVHEARYGKHPSELGGSKTDKPDEWNSKKFINYYFQELKEQFRGFSSPRRWVWNHHKAEHCGITFMIGLILDGSWIYDLRDREYLLLLYPRAPLRLWFWLLYTSGGETKSYWVLLLFLRGPCLISRGSAMDLRGKLGLNVDCIIHKTLRHLIELEVINTMLYVG